MLCDFCYCTCLYSVGDAAEVRKIDVLILAEHVCRGVADELKLVLVSAPDALHERGEGVAARVRRERPDAGNGLNRGGELVAEVRRVARFIPALARPEIRLAVCTQLPDHAAVGFGYRHIAHTRRALCRADEHCSLYLFNRLPDMYARAVRLDVPGLERQQLLRAHTCEIQGHKRGVWTGAQAPSASV